LFLVGAHKDEGLALSKETADGFVFGSQAKSEAVLCFYGVVVFFKVVIWAVFQFSYPAAEVGELLLSWRNGEGIPAI
jgi:hypothetical protein